MYHMQAAFFKAATLTKQTGLSFARLLQHASSAHLFGGHVAAAARYGRELYMASSRRGHLLGPIGTTGGSVGVGH
jgi:hypothetical protein